MPGNETRSARCRVNVLPTVLSLWPMLSLFLCFAWNLLQTPKPPHCLPIRSQVSLNTVVMKVFLLPFFQPLFSLLAACRCSLALCLPPTHCLLPLGSLCLCSGVGSLLCIDPVLCAQFLPNLACFLASSLVAADQTSLEVSLQSQS